jgi:hypothetical protein
MKSICGDASDRAGPSRAVNLRTQANSARHPDLRRMHDMIVAHSWTAFVRYAHNFVDELWGGRHDGAHGAFPAYGYLVPQEPT